MVTKHGSLTVPTNRPSKSEIVLSLLVLSLPDPRFQGQRQIEKKNGFE
jgi:hypothetical protein